MASFLRRHYPHQVRRVYLTCTTRCRTPNAKVPIIIRFLIATEQARTNMVEQQIRTWEVLDQDVLDLLYVVPREEFVPEKHRALAFSDMEVPIGEGERMWQPKMEARVLQELSLRKTDRVLEVGTGSGYLTALMSHRASRVFSVEINPKLAELGRANLERHGADGVT